MHSHAHDECACSSAPSRSHSSERRLHAVILLCSAVMVIEIIAGNITGSLALAADGWHMATHIAALGLAAFAYWYARTERVARSLTFGPSKVYALAGYTNSVVLGLAGGWIVVESIHRLLRPEPVAFFEALPVAVVGLLVNLASVVLLGGEEPNPFPHEHAHAHDHNARAALAHVLADAVTSVFAIVALLVGRWLNWTGLDALSGGLGGVIIVRWGFDLARDSVRHLLDMTPSAEAATTVRTKLEAIDDVRVADLHIWNVAPGVSSCIATLVTSSPRDTAVYREAILAAVPFQHLTVEVRRCPGDH